MRTHYCGHVSEAQIGEEVELAGWMHRRRDHGGVIFIDLRDREGLVQVVFDPDRPDVFAVAEKVRGEYVLRVRGTVRPRPEGTVNERLASGGIEVLASEVEVLNASETPPFHHDESASEEIRLRYRYLDLRREEMTRNLRLRHSVTRAIRNCLDEQGFIDIETPMLTQATPEGARDYLVPSRTQPGCFFSLPRTVAHQLCSGMSDLWLKNPKQNSVQMNPSPQLLTPCPWTVHPLEGGLACVPWLLERWGWVQ